MNETKDKKTEFDELDASIAAALGDESAWPVPGGGFEERCTARVEALLKSAEVRRARWSPVQLSFPMKLAASIAVIIGAASIAFNAAVTLKAPASYEPGAVCAKNDFGSKCEFTMKLLERNVSRKAATEFLANVCMACGI